jgi:hypothetical protein
MFALPPDYHPQQQSFRFKTEALCAQARELAIDRLQAEHTAGLIVIARCRPEGR